MVTGRSNGFSRQTASTRQRSPSTLLLRVSTQGRTRAPVHTRGRGVTCLWWRLESGALFPPSLQASTDDYVVTVFKYYFTEQFKKLLYSRGRGREVGAGGEGVRKEVRERNIDQLPPVHAPTGTEPQPRHVPGLGMEPATFCLRNNVPTSWTRLGRATEQFQVPRETEQKVQRCSSLPG